MGRQSARPLIERVRAGAIPLSWRVSLALAGARFAVDRGQNTVVAHAAQRNTKLLTPAPVPTSTAVLASSIPGRHRQCGADSLGVTGSAPISLALARAPQSGSRPQASSTLANYLFGVCHIRPGLSGLPGSAPRGLPVSGFSSNPSNSHMACTAMGRLYASPDR